MNESTASRELLQQLRQLATTKLGAPDERYNQHFQHALQPLSQLKAVDEVAALRFDISFLQHETHLDLLFASAVYSVLNVVKKLVSDYVDAVGADATDKFKALREYLWNAIDKAGMFLGAYCVRQYDDQPIDADELRKLKTDKAGDNDVPIVTVDVYELWPVYSKALALLKNKSDAESLLKLLCYGIVIQPIQLKASPLKCNEFLPALVSNAKTDVAKWVHTYFGVEQ